MGYLIWWIINIYFTWNILKARLEIMKKQTFVAFFEKLKPTKIAAEISWPLVVNGFSLNASI